MDCKGNFVFKTLEKREGGTFTNDKGEDIKYTESYVMKVDEIANGKINERKFKFPVTNREFARKLDELDAYTKVTIIFDVTMYSNSCKLVPIDVIVGTDEN